jgi:hypothetical protein
MTHAMCICANARRGTTFDARPSRCRRRSRSRARRSLTRGRLLQSKSLRSRIGARVRLSPGISFATEGKGSVIQTSDHSWALRRPSLSGGPIQPNERRTIEIDGRVYPELGPPTLLLAVFEDGYIEGTTDAINLWQKSVESEPQTPNSGFMPSRAYRWATTGSRAPVRPIGPAARQGSCLGSPCASGDRLHAAAHDDVCGRHQQSSRRGD